jgi:hypothetical protein
MALRQRSIEKPRIRDTPAIRIRDMPATRARVADGIGSPSSDDY